jgi:aryl-alcohol dehydrogenase
VQIRAAVATGKAEPFAVWTLELDEPRADEVLVRVVATGVCHSDLSVRDGLIPRMPYPAVLGHEGAGIVERVGGTVTRLQPGDHVVMSRHTCGACVACREGQPSYCHIGPTLNTSGGRADGSKALHQDSGTVGSHFFGQSSFGTYALANERNTIKVASDLPLELLGPLGCGVQTGAGSVINSLRAEPGSSIAVFGAGAVGLSAIMAARVVGCTKIIAVDVRSNRLEIARELGATDVVNAAETDVVDSLRSLSTRGMDYSLETTAAPNVFRQAVEALRPGGVCGLIGAAPAGTEVSFDMNSIMVGRTIRGIMLGDSIPEVFIPRLIELYRQSRFPFDRLMRFYSLDGINQAAEDSLSGVTVKPIVRMI